MIWIWTTLICLTCLTLVIWAFHAHFRRRFLPVVVRIFQEVPYFNVPRGEPVEAAEEVRFPTTDGLTLQGCYLKTPQAQRRGVVLFGLEYGSNRWSCVPYCEHLRQTGYDIFTYEPRSQGDSDTQPGYKPLHWVTQFELDDANAALAYLKARPDADPRGIGVFGISKGGTAGLMAAAGDPWVRCVATDGIFGIYTTMIPYMKKWLAIYSQRYFLQKLVPTWYFNIYARLGLREVEQALNCRFIYLRQYVSKLARPWLMIHGANDTYIKPEMAQVLFDFASPPKESWIVEGAKHNQAIQVAREEYQRRILDFFDRHLATKQHEAEPAITGPSRNGHHTGEPSPNGHHEANKDVPLLAGQ